MIDYYTLYHDTLFAIHYHQIKTGSSLLSHLLNTKTAKKLQEIYPDWEIKEIIFYNLDCLIESNIVSAIETPLSDINIYIIEGLTPLGMHYITNINKNTKHAVENWHKERDITQNAHSVLNAFYHIFF